MQKLKSILKYIYKYSHLFIAIVGIACIIFQKQIFPILPYLFGGVMIAIGLFGLAFSILKLIVNDKKSQAFAYSLVLLVLGIVFIKNHASNESIIYIGIAWGMLGLFRGGTNVIHGIEQIRQKKASSIITLIEAAFTMVVASIILFEPIEAIPDHIVLLGIELLAVSICSFFGFRESASLWNVVDIHQEDGEINNETKKIKEEK